MQRTQTSLQLGLTLIELLITIAILASLLHLALPNHGLFRNIIQAKQGVNQFALLFTYARQQAIYHRKSIVVCASYNQHDCHENTQWANSFLLIFIDENRNRRVDTEDTILRTSEKTDSNTTVTWNGSGRNSYYIRWEATGHAYPNGTLTYCPNNGNPLLAKGLILNQGGRVYQAIDSNNDGIVENGSGHNLEC